MKRQLCILGSALLLTACGSTIQTSNTLEEHLKNPLFAERYYEDLVGRMTEIQIRNPDLSEKDKDLASVVEKTKNDALEAAKAEARKRMQGMSGRFIELEEATQGFSLLRENTFYLSSDFVTYPGPSLHMYLTAVVDPRDVTFPDATAIDLGLISSPYGHQSYSVPQVADSGSGALRTAVLYDTTLKRVYGFAQLAR